MKPPSRKELLPLFCVLALGAGCVYAASLLNAGVTPTLFVNFTRRPDGSMPLYFHNTGKGGIRLDAEGLEYFLFRPAGGGHRHILHIRSRLPARSGLKTLRPGGSLEVGDMRPFIAQLPDNTALSLTAVYAGLLETDRPDRPWGGEVRSFPLTIQGGEE